MVRGAAHCPSLCHNCRQDCFCDCGYCHYCSSKTSDTEFPALCQNVHNCPAAVEVQIQPEKAHKLSDLAKLFESEIYKVVIGQGPAIERKTFFIHKDLLNQKAAYFKGLFNFNSNNEKDEVLLATEVDKPSAFACIVQYMYMGDYEPVAGTDKMDLLPHAEVYVLAERLQAEDGLKKLALKKATAAAVMLSTAASQLCIVTGQSTTGNDRKLLNDFHQVIRVVYENTPAHGQDTASSSVAKSKQATANKNKRKADQIQSPGTWTETKEPFRLLVSKLAGTSLSHLKHLSRFKECMDDFTDFAQGLVMDLGPTKPLEADLEGKLKLN